VIKQLGADKYELAEKFPTVKDARTCYLDQESGRIYLGVPRQKGQPGPEIRVYEPKP